MALPNREQHCQDGEIGGSITKAGVSRGLKKDGTMQLGGRNVSRSLGWAFVAVCMLALTACGDDGADDHFDARDPGKLLAWIQKYHPASWSLLDRDARTTLADGVLLIEVKPVTNKANDISIYNAGNYVVDTLKVYTKAADNKDALKIIKVVYSAEFADRYGNSVGTKPVLIIDFDVAEGIKYNFGRVLAFGMMDTATIEYDYNQAAQEYCKSDREYSPIFCDILRQGH
jgi:hypothetical protein